MTDDGYDDAAVINALGLKFKPPMTRPWVEIEERMDKLWIPGEAPHMSVIAQTRGGKSF